MLHKLVSALKAPHVRLDSHRHVGSPGPEAAVTQDGGAGGGEHRGGLLGARTPVRSVEDVARVHARDSAASESLPRDDGALVGLAPALGDACLGELVGDLDVDDLNLVAGGRELVAERDGRAGVGQY